MTNNQRLTLIVITIITAFVIYGMTSFIDGGYNQAVELASGHMVDSVPDVIFELKTGLQGGRMVYIGVAGDIAGVINPTLVVDQGDVAQIILVNGDSMEHDISVPDFGVTSPRISAKGEVAKITFHTDQAGSFAYFCTMPGHRQGGMEGQLIVNGTGGHHGNTQPMTAARIAADPTDIPPPLNGRPAKSVKIELTAVELEGNLASGETYTYWTFNGQVPGPFLRVRQGDTVELTLKNDNSNHMAHSIDLHAVTGPHGGGMATQTPPGEFRTITFKAIKPGLYVYHCATPSVGQHIANGMYGMILVEPADGLPKVDREFYVMQGEMYTVKPFGAKGLHEYSHDKMLAATPEYFVLNGSVDALTDIYPLKAAVGETVRIFFGVGGPNMASSFHVIGEMFDRVYSQAALTSSPLTNVQTTLVPPGGATVVEFVLEVPGRYMLVDHAISRTEKGLMGFLDVEGEQQPDIFYVH
jgi:nitrite reductase (NO-forming)